MKLTHFTYTKDNGDVSSRTVHATVVPGKMYAGTDLSELSDTDIGQYASAYDKIHDAFMLEVAALNESFDLKHSFRQFKESNISNIEFEFI